MKILILTLLGMGQYWYAPCALAIAAILIRTIDALQIQYVAWAGDWWPLFVFIAIVAIASKLMQDGPSMVQ